ncbi:carbamoyl transferase [Nitritalea halalkaliphila LW7]|uniref:Carbamoyl transferase n=1 Tax=Nitritalea halalkaliphila LW7 TaxID=1189621 RepID=I5C619_9BACT|nr:carbamoyltransferase C-terminal domain-containing protein [Nitritalea halalkaliphila]EIM77271.1 carbamoyl transferase [Nitritalea halalkaliphila LW7]
MNILGIRYGGHDSAATLMVNGVIVAASSQERFDHQKHSRAFPLDAAKDCLKMAGLSMDDVDEIAFANDSLFHVKEFYLKQALESDERIGFLIRDIDRLKQAYEMESIVREYTGFKGPINFYRHHLCHMASAYYPSGFENAILMSLDGMGEIETGMYGLGKSGEIEILYKDTIYPNSLGLIYSAMTFYLGWRNHCDEGIIMGLASYGDPHATIPNSDRTYYDLFSEIIQEEGDLGYRINKDWIVYDKVRNKWVSDKFYDLMGPKRNWEDKITPHHQHIAAALQLRLETIVLKHLRFLREKTGVTKLCIAGGVGLNCSLNGVIERSRIFDEIFVQPASGDDGSTLGACFMAAKAAGLPIVPEKNHNYYLGSGATDEEILQALEESGAKYTKPVDLYATTARLLAEGNIIAWFQGRAEFGPRALGNRSILTRPFPASMKDYVNNKVKFREEFRPFAPAVLKEHCSTYFDIRQESPHMLIACKVQPDKKELIPAVVHVDNTCRVQTVGEENNPRFRKLLEAFQAETDVPVLMNTSFNVKGQPIVNTPEEAIKCFQNTAIDHLIVGDYLLSKS